ncbi:hypothetical protein E6C76_06380 [Pseudothauera nasutitermitis]|uniref:UPF0225 protein E6C76_06380 n=1 Tax=Pseudothauera nasutitermitis TaxID=2565930 RepID=A0A4S4B1P2_9RHOO|nr:YchJ family metal-binding protein [Pseudothauera nasutitermitis]THF66464.1 hypothetical protein E6C76_06380 [Pseudothauera nasutitermitis]
MPRKTQAPCPCESGQPYADCCGPAHDGRRPPTSAEALMRSRYSAFALGRADWLLASWHASTRPATLDLAEDPAPKWIGLRVLRHEQRDENHAIVEFVARYRLGGRAARLHELSRFVREDGHWYYVDGDPRED